MSSSQLLHTDDSLISSLEITPCLSLAAQARVDLKPLLDASILYALTIAFQDAIAAFNATIDGRGEDGRGVIKAIISGPDTSVDDN